MVYVKTVVTRLDTAENRLVQGRVEVSQTLQPPPPQEYIYIYAVTVLGMILPLNASETIPKDPNLS